MESDCYTRIAQGIILERLLFKHKTEEIYLLADAYDGEFIQACIEEFIKASNRQNVETITFENQSISFGGDSDLLAYIGHDGLMEFDVNIKHQAQTDEGPDVIILACYSKEFFSHHIKQAGANPLLWTTHLMAPEAYTLKAAIDGWGAK